MELRVAEASDQAALAGLILDFRDYLGATRPTSEEIAAFLPTLLEDRSTEFCLASSGEGEPQGYSHCRFFPSLWTTGTEAHLEDLYVLEAMRGRGVGRRLLDFALERAERRGARAIGLHTNEHNEGAQALYRRTGFAPQTEARWDGGREIYWARSLSRR